MTNVPPPDPNSSRLGFDELIGVVIAFATIGTILAVTLSQRDKGFNLKRLFNSQTGDRTTQPQGTLPPLIAPQPTVTPQPTPPPRTAQLAPSPVPVVTPHKEVRPVPVVVQAAPKAETSPAPTPVATASPIKFTDVPQDLWARPYIEALAARGIISGFPDGTFKPGGSITRAEFAALLQKAFEQKPKLKARSFKDVQPNFWALPAIQETASSGFLQGYSQDTFRPNQPIPKVQVLVALSRGLALIPDMAPQEMLKTYQDGAQIPDYAKAPVSAATKAGLVVNYPNPKVLNPNRNATRAEVAAMVYQAMVQAGKVQAISSQYVVKP
jgi:hypothetical protein